MNVNVVEINGRSVMEEALPQGGEVDIRVCEEEESDLELRVSGGEVRKCGRVRERSSAVEERKIVNLVRERDWKGRMSRRKETWG